MAQDRPQPLAFEDQLILPAYLAQQPGNSAWLTGAAARSIWDKGLPTAWRDFPADLGSGRAYPLATSPESLTRDLIGVLRSAVEQQVAKSTRAVLAVPFEWTWPHDRRATTLIKELEACGFKIAALLARQIAAAAFYVAQVAGTVPKTVLICDMDEHGFEDSLIQVSAEGYKVLDRELHRYGERYAAALIVGQLIRDTVTVI